MKIMKTVKIYVILLIISLTCISCAVAPAMQETPENAGEPPASATPAAPSLSPEASEKTSPGADETPEVPPVGPDENVADKLNVADHWYDWDRLGAPPVSRPMNNFVESDQYIFYISYADNALNRADLDGQNKTSLVKGAVTCVNYLDGWVYYSTAEGIFKVRPDGSQDTMLTDNGALQIIVMDKTIYFVDILNTLGKIDIDGKNYKLLDEDALFLQYDGDAVYFGQAGTENYEGQADIARYDAKTGKKSVLAKGILWSPGIAVYRGVLYYLDTDGSINMMDVKEKTVKKFATAGTPAEDPFILTIFGDFIICVSTDNEHETNSIFRLDAASGEISKIVNDPDCDNLYPSRKNLYTYSSVTDEYYIIRQKADGFWEEVKIVS